MSLPNPFKLAKLTIAAYAKVARGDGDKVGELVVPFNPDTLSTRHESVFGSEATVGCQGGVPPWVHSRGHELTVVLLFDGTGVSDIGPPQLSVAPMIARFLGLCYQVHGDTHEALFLRLTWGTGVLGKGFDCRLRSASIQYTAFERDGAPLRAQITATFFETVDPSVKQKELRLSSPDLTHRRVVRAGDTLPALCREIYGSPAHHVRVAQVNGLDGLRELRPGQELFFPPFAPRERP